MVNDGYKQCQADRKMFMKRKDGILTMSIVYVDIVVTGKDDKLTLLGTKQCPKLIDQTKITLEKNKIEPNQL